VLENTVPSAEAKLDPISGKVKEILSSENKELYVEKIVSSEIKDTENQRITIDLICKNLLKGAESCVDIFFFSLVDTSGEEYQPKLIGSKILAARIPARDIVHGSLTFVIPKAENVTKLIYSENEGSDFEIDLSSTKDPLDKPPESEWKLVRNKGLKLADSNIELRIYDETRTDNYYVMDLSIRNIGSGIVNYHALYAYLKSASGFVFDPALYAAIESKIESGTLQYGQQVRGKIAFDTGNESGPFMLIYDDIAGSYFATGQLVPKISSEVTGEIIGTEDLVRISKYNAYWDPSTTTYKIIGEVSNESGKPVNEIKINSVLRDKSGEVISKLNSTLTGYVETVSVTLPTNASLPFFLEFNIPSTTANNVGSYELSISYSFSKPKIAVLEIKSAVLVQASKPTPLSKYILWQIRGEMENTGDSRSTHTRITAALYDSNNSIVGVGGFSVLDQQPRDLNPGQSKLFSIEIALPKSFQPSSFYIYAESDQFVGTESKTETAVEIEPESTEPLPFQSKNQTLIKIMSKQREDLLQFSIKNLPNSTSIYGIHISISEPEIRTLKSKLRWNSEETAQNELLLNTANNSIRAGQETRFLFSVGSDVDMISWKLLDLDGEVLLEGKVKPFQIRQ
ncbi:MAG: DUF4352 domain-containing protein, partial [Nitrososphaerales archaeon]